MARLSIHIPVFIACASDVIQERDIAKNEIERLQEEVKWDNLHLSTFHWRWDSRTTVLRAAQPSLTEYLSKSELAIIIFGNRLGSPISIDNSETGMQHELRIATEKVMEGTSDDVLLYFKKDITNIELIAYKKQIEDKRIFLWEYEDEEDFQRILHDHLNIWIDRWKLIPIISEYALRNSDKEYAESDFLGENKMVILRRACQFEDYELLAKHLGKHAINLYQSFGAKDSYNSRIVIDKNIDYKPFIDSGHNSFPKPLIEIDKHHFKFSHVEWFYFFCAVGLDYAILGNDTRMVANYPYINPIHQYLALRITGSKKHTNNLRDWLLNKSGITKGQPIARNFAAYVLGMVHAKEAEDDLAYAALNDLGEDVKVYAVMSLGKIRSRKHMDLLVALWSSPNIQDSLKLFISQSISNIIGITNYPH